MKDNSRFIAAQIINEVTSGRSLSESLDRHLAAVKDPRDRALIQAICYGVCRFYTRLDVALSYLLKKPMNAKDTDVHALLMVGLYQLIDMRVPEHAAVAETVEATKKLNKPWARGLVNAILREYLRNKDKIENKLNQDEEALFAHPYWWIKAIKKAWPEQWQDILKANNEHPPFALRVNLKNITREKYLEKLQTENLQAESMAETKAGLQLATPMDVVKLPGFDDGDISVQDGGAQLTAEVLELDKDQRVLDACAAPGGKLAHILELEPDLAECVALEIDKTRIPSITENLTRLKLKAKVICADAADTKKWWDNQLFDRILIDAPCSASGVIRRHPDIKLLREPKDIIALAKEQLRLLNALWPLLKENGILLYVTCSIFPEENFGVIEKFLSNHADAKEEKLTVSWGIPQIIGRQLLPGMNGMDGFYFAKLRKQYLK